MSDKALLIRNTVNSLSAASAPSRALIGFDGFVDEIIHLVNTRKSADSYTPITTIEQFGRRISEAAGLSCNIEMVPQQVKLGGNGPIMANALLSQGHNVTYIGALGADEVVHHVFRDFAEGCEEVVTLCDPAHTDALEFEDGKIMMGKMDTLPQVNWERLLALRSREELQSMMNGLGLIGVVNWTMLPGMNTLLEGFHELLSERQDNSPIFIDLADPRKRSPRDIREVLNILIKMQENADVVLGLNEGESLQIESVLFRTRSNSLTRRTQKIRTELGLSQVVIHPSRSAVVATQDGEWLVEGPYTPKPKLTTGAGDNFNAGYCNGLLAGLDPEQCLVSGVCTSGFYVRNCHSPNREELIEFMNLWAEVNGGDLP